MWSELLSNENKLRPGQLGSLLALKAHFLGSQYDIPAQVHLPTGYGKTLVMLMAHRLLNPSALTLVVCSSTVLRLQLWEAFAGYFGQDLEGPLPATSTYARSVLALPSDHKEEAHVKDSLDPERGPPKSATVVVAHPNSLKDYAQTGIGLILFDEGHHTPAKTWRSIRELNPAAKVIQFTATPFRGDHDPLLGRMTFSYPLVRAIGEGSIENATIEVVEEPAKSETELPEPWLDRSDRLLANRVLEVLKDARALTSEAKLLVKCGDTKRAQSVYALYTEVAASLALRVLLVHSQLDAAESKLALKRLNSKDYDIVVAVEMLAEGVDIPEIRVLAIHDSVSDLRHFVQVTGRITRLLRDGSAAAPSHLLAFRAALPPALSPVPKTLADLTRHIEKALTNEDLKAQLSDHLQGGEIPPQVFDGLIQEASLREQALVYTVDPTTVTVWEGLKKMGAAINARFMRYEWGTPVRRLQVALLSIAYRPTWLNALSAPYYVPGLILTYEPDTAAGDQRLMFVTSSPEAKRYLRFVVTHINKGQKPLQRLGLSKLKKVFSAGSSVTYFNVGLRARLPMPTLERYRIATGPEVERSVNATTVHNFAQGHVMGRLTTAANAATNTEEREELLGVSDRGSLWGVNTVTLDQLCHWYSEAATRIRGATGVAASVLETVPQPLDWGATRLPSAPGHIGFWGTKTILRSPTVVGGPFDAVKLAELQITKIASKASDESLEFSIARKSLGKGTTPSIHVKLEARGTELSCSPSTTLREDGETWPLEKWLEEDPPTLFLSNGMSVTGASVSPPLTRGSETAFFAERLYKLDWSKVDIDKEKPTVLDPPPKGTTAPALPASGFRYEPATATDKSIFRSVACSLISLVKAKKLHAALCDDNSGELADFIAARTDASGSLVIELYLCKGTAKDADPGLRAPDVGELWTQAMRATQLLSREDMIDHVGRRKMSLVKMSNDVAADKANLLSLLRSDAPLRFEMMLVQPGLALGNFLPPFSKKVSTSTTLVHAFAWLESSLRQRGVDLYLVGSPTAPLARGRPAKGVTPPAAPVLPDIFTRY